MGFDFQNFGLGVLAGWASAYGVYRARYQIGRVITAIRGGAASAQTSATQSADSRYIQDMVRLAEAGHLAGRFARLSELVVEPRFLPAPALAAPPDEDAAYDVFHVVPIIPDFPQLHAPYNLETLSIDDLSTGDRAIALLGQPGSGRTVALLTILLRSLGRVRFEQPIDTVQQRLDAEEAALSDKQRAVRIKERLMIEQRAKERLAEEQGIAFDADAEQSAKSALPIFNRLMPVYIHLADIDAKAAEFGGEVDPAEPLVRAVQRQVGRITAQTIPANLYRRLGQGQVLLLLDGFDDLPEAERPRALAWLQALMETYPDNFFIAAGPIIGSGGLLRLGLTPVYLRPWNTLDQQRFIRNWLAAWPQIGGTRRSPAPKPDAAALRRIHSANRGLSPLELTLRLWSICAGDTETGSVEGWMRGYLARHLPPDTSFGLVLPQLTQAAVIQLDEGFFTQSQLDRLFARPTSAGEKGSAPAKPEKRQAGGDSRKDETAARFITLLRRARLIDQHMGGRCRFIQLPVAAYLASLSFKEAEPGTLARLALLPAWSQAVGYGALHSPVDDAVRARLNTPPDVLYSQALTVAYWMPYAPAEAAWRTPYLKFLAGLLTAPAQYPLLRERAAAALVTTGAPGAITIFRAALKSSQPQIQRLACLGLGALGHAETVADLRPLLESDDADVQLAAGLGLGAIGTEEALEALITALTQGEEKLRQAAAESFAAIPDQGYPVLYDAIADEDILLRRAAVFGLRRIKTPWALIAIYRTFLEDQQWYVRSAAQMAFHELQYGRDNGPRRYPQPHSLTWLAEWAAARGQNIKPGAGAVEMLIAALQQGEPPIRQLAAAVIGQLGLASSISMLYETLCDPIPDVRENAHRALGNLQMQIGQGLPLPA